MAKNDDAPTAPADIHVGAYMPPADVARIDAWAKRQLDGEGVSRSTAFRMLVARGLAASGPRSQWSKAKSNKT